MEDAALNPPLSAEERERLMRFPPREQLLKRTLHRSAGHCPSDSPSSPDPSYPSSRHLRHPNPLPAPQRVSPAFTLSFAPVRHCGLLLSLSFSFSLTLALSCLLS